MSTSLYGAIVTAPQVGAAVTATLKAWFPAYLAELERQEDIEPGTLKAPVPAAYKTTSVDMENWPSNHLPGVIVFSPGTFDTPERAGDGSHQALFEVGVGVVVKGRDEDNAEYLAGIYAAAARAALVQHGSLGGFASGIEWLGERTDVIEDDSERTLRAAVIALVVDVPNVVDAFAGPLEPPADPLADPTPWPSVATAGVDVTKGEPS